MRQLEVRVIAEREQLPLCREEWNRLVADNEVSTVFQTFEWFDAWWKTLAGDFRLHFLCVYDDDRIVGFAALMRRRFLAGFSQLEFVATGNADYQDIIASPQDKADVIEAICRYLRTTDMKWHRLRLCNVPSQARTLSHLRETAIRFDMRLLQEATVSCPALALAPDVESARQRIDKYSLRRPLNWFRKHGTVEFRTVVDQAEADSLLPAFFEQHVKRWAMAGRKSPLERAPEQSFFFELTRNARRAGWLHFSVVMFNGRPLAFHYGFEHRGVLTWYKPTFDVSFAQHSPGLLLIQQLVQDGLQRGCRELDFTIGDEPFKERFADRHRQNVHASLYRSRALWIFAWAIRLARRILGRFRRFIAARR